MDPMGIDDHQPIDDVFLIEEILRISEGRTNQPPSPSWKMSWRLGKPRMVHPGRIRIQELKKYSHPKWLWQKLNCENHMFFNGYMMFNG